MTTTLTLDTVSTNLAGGRLFSLAADVCRHPRAAAIRRCPKPPVVYVVVRSHHHPTRTSSSLTSPAHHHKDNMSSSIGYLCTTASRETMAAVGLHGGEPAVSLES